MGIFLIWLFRTTMMIFWILDICDMPFMEIFDTTYPLNGLFWFLVWILINGNVEITTSRRK